VNKLRLFTQFFLTKKLHGPFLFFFRFPLREKKENKISAGWVNYVCGLGETLS